MPEIAITLELRVWQVDHFGNKVARQRLIEIFFGELNRDRVVCQVGSSAVASRFQLRVLD